MLQTVMQTVNVVVSSKQCWIVCYYYRPLTVNNTVANQIMSFPITLSDLAGHSPLATF